MAEDENDEIINNICYADNTTIIADNEKNFQYLLNEINEVKIQYGLIINIYGQV